MPAPSLHVRWLVSILAAVALLLAACGGPAPAAPAAPPPTPTEIPVLDEPVDEPSEPVDEPVDDDVETEETDGPEIEAPEIDDVDEADADATPEPVEEADPDATPEPAEEAADDDAAMQGDEAFVTSITLPDGAECLHTRLSALMLIFDEMQVNYICTGDEEGVLLGDMSTQLDMLTVTYGVLTDDNELESSEEIEMRIAEITLADGTVCRNAGQGATAAFDEQRVNFTCDEDDDSQTVLLGDLQIEMDIVSATVGTMSQGDDGLEMGETETVYVTEIVGEEAN